MPRIFAASSLFQLTESRTAATWVFCISAREMALPAAMGEDALAFVADGQGRGTPHSAALDADAASAGIDGVLHQLGDGLARVALAAGQPADEIEGVSGLEQDALCL